MSGYYGDFKGGQTVRCRFNTANSSGVPTTLSSGAVTVSKDGSDIAPSGGVTLLVDHGGVAGRHTVVIDTSVDTSSFAAGSDYSVRLSGSSNVGGTSVAGEVVGEFSIANRASVPQTGDAYARIGAAGAGLAAIPYTGPSVGAIASAVLTDTTDTLGAALLAIKMQTDKLLFDGSSNVKSAPQTAVTLPSIPANWIAAAGIAAGALNGKGDWLSTLGATAPANWINTAAFASSGVTIPDARLAYLTAPVALASQIPANFTSATFASAGVFATAALANAPSGGSGGATAGQIATAVWQDLLASSDFTTTGSVGALIAANLDAKVSSRSTYAGGAVASVSAPVTVGTNNDKSGYNLAAAGLDAVMVTTSLNARRVLNTILALLGGRLSGVPVAGQAGTVIVRDIDNTVNVATIGVDGNGNRTSTSITPPA